MRGKRQPKTSSILSYEGWQTFFARDPAVIGKTLRIEGHPVTVIGVLPPGMRFPQIALSPKIAFQETAGDALLFQPLAPSERDLNADMGNFNYKAIARLKPGVTLAQANAELEAMQNAYTLSAHLPLHFGIALTPLAKDVASSVSGALWMLFAAVGAVLLIACVNLANLQLARAVNAERETAVRAALGASRGQLVRSRLAESLVLAFVGGAAGMALAFGGVRLLIALVPANVPRLDEVHVSHAGAAVCRRAVDCGGNRVRHAARAALASRCSASRAAGKLHAHGQYAGGPPYAQPDGGGAGGVHGGPAHCHVAGAAQSFSPSAAGSRLRFEPRHAGAGRPVRAAIWRFLHTKMRPDWALPTARSRLSVNCPACSRWPSPA